MSYKLSNSPEILKQQFYLLTNPRDVATLLDVKFSDLTYYLYRMQSEEKYEIFTIPKKSGGSREIMSPHISIKILQQKLLQILEVIYSPKKCVHGFVKFQEKSEKRSIKTNAYKHRKQRYVLNIDLKDFFPSINFGRVRGLFMSYPYKLPSEVATVLAQLCCYENQLPQGAPTSPIISNMICSQLDNQLQRLARENRCYYTRYGDDITFSTSLKQFPNNIAYQTGNTTRVGLSLSNIVRNNGFEIHPKKVRLQKWYHRQDVTGIIVNEFTNVPRKFVRQIRAMLYDWSVNGYENAQDRYWELFDDKSRHRHPDRERPAFHNIVQGKLAYLKMVRSSEDKIDEIYQRFLGKYRYLFKRDNSVLDVEYIMPEAGKTFISYSRQDENFCRRLAYSLSGIDEELWLDVNDIPAGMKWSSAIQEGLDECDIMLLIISPDSILSTNVEDEWQYFIDASKPIIPVYYRSVVNMPYQISRKQYIDFRERARFSQKFRDLKREIYGLRQS